MEKINNSSQEKSLSRKKFFTRSATAVVGLAIFSSFPFKLFKNQDSKNKKTIDVKINPYAVSRKKTGNKNV